ncbi:MAG: Rpn family recombination-promoting nuclease/putative transposase [Saprospiraceae bacterium]|nr:Rpn family recombination-promoting nuclease/putative transposase [Saprospiraceae bacterium]
MNEKILALLHSPHPFDTYFKSVFGIVEAARQLIEFAVPKEILEKMDLDTLTLASDTYIDEKLRKSMSDLVYVCDYERGQKARICVLFEHKSTHPGRMVYPQVGRYLTGAQEEDVRQNRENFTLTIPILFYHGEDAWNPKPLHSLYGAIPGELARFIPAFDFLVVNLQKMSRDEILAIREFSLLRNIFLAMKRAWDDNFFRKHYRDIVIFVDENVRDEALLLLFDLTWLFVQHISSLKTEDFMEIATALPQPQEQKAKTVIEQFREKFQKEGMEKGMEKGMEVAMEKSIRQIMLKRPQMPDEEIADLLDVSLEKVKKVRASLQQS